jgi:hypothetical protein
MSPDIDQLLSIAEIAGVFLGFGTLITILSPKEYGPDGDYQMFRLVLIVVTSVAVVQGTLIPSVFYHLGFEEATTWRISAITMYVINLISLAIVLGVRPSAIPVEHKNHPGLALLLWLMEATIHGSLIICMSPYLDDYSSLLYFAAIYALMFQISVGFVTFVVDAARHAI